MVSIRRYLSLRALAVGFAATLTACADQGITAPGAVPVALSAARVKSGPTLLACPGLNTESASAVIGADGGTLSVGGHVMTVPAGAVPTPTRFTMAVPPGRYMELDITAEGHEHYTFARPVTIAVNYGRCRGRDIPASSLDAWYIDSDSKALIDEMDGVDHRAERTVVFSTDHLSGYILLY